MRSSPAMKDVLPNRLHREHRARASAEVGLCLLLAAADGEISDAELAALTTRVGKVLGEDFPMDELAPVVEGEMTAISELGVDAYVAELAGRIHEDRRAEALKSACEVACADGLSPEEQDMLRAAGRALDVDVAAFIGAIGYRNTVHSGSHDHEDPPDDRTRLLDELLTASGWVDPMKDLRDAGIHVGGFGALALQFEAPNAHVLRVEHHTCDGSLRFQLESHTADLAFVAFPEGREADLVDALLAIQRELSIDNAAEWLAELSRVARLCVERDGELVELGA